MKLIAFTIEKLWGDKKISIQLNEDVNIFSGINGSGKTTIVGIIYTILDNNLQDEDYCRKYESAQLMFTGGYQVDVTTKDGVKTAIYKKNDIETAPELFYSQLSFACVASFDYAPMSAEERRELKEKFVWVRSELDYVLARAIQDYYMYVVSISNQIRKALDVTSSKTRQHLRKYFDMMSKMQNICDELFAPSLKWDRDSDDVQFVLLKYDNKRITPHDLSAGEKQMLILLINTLTQRNQECVVLWDEPELSMHVDWQTVLIKTMRDINPEMQLIITTHSPFILYDGWEKRVVNIQNLIK